MDFLEPRLVAQGAEAIRIGHEAVPGGAASIDDGAVVGEDPQRQEALAQVEPDPLDGLVMVPLCVTFLVAG
jgi:hypothetical protein